MSAKLIKCSKISVNCTANDPVDIRCGGPKFLGFDFNVREDQASEMTKFIIMTLNELEVPLIDIETTGTIDVGEQDIWTKQRIVQEIQKDAEYLRHEAKRNYGASNKRCNL